jgi:hypothetical protein
MGGNVLAEYKLTDEYKEEKAEMDREFKNFILYGTPTTWFNDNLLKEIIDYSKKIKL